MNIIITGASRGIGFDTALALAAYPQHSILAISRNAGKLQYLKQQADEQHGHGNLSFISYDLTDPDKKSLEKEIDAMGGVDILINNAGLLINKPFEELDTNDWRMLFEVNFFGVVALTRAVLPYLKVAANAHILNISSMGGYQGSSKFPGLSGYSASKAALANLTECLAEELKGDNIRVNCLALGAVQTEMLEEAFPGMQAPVDCEEMGSFVAWFCENGQRFFNGKVLPVSVSTP